MTDFDQAKSRYFQFIQNQRVSDTQFRLAASHHDPSPYALLFAIFGYDFCGKTDELDPNLLVPEIMDQVTRAREWARSDLFSDKPFLQLLTFSLSALSILDPLGKRSGQWSKEFVLTLLDPNVTSSIPSILDSLKVADGHPGSGNRAMFLGILLLFLKNQFGTDKTPDWVAYHLKHKQSHGFWGKPGALTYEHFQNGYHQYEVLDYLGLSGWLNEAQVLEILKLADRDGHFAPWPGGDGCYDYDAVCLITRNLPKQHPQALAVLNCLLQSLKLEQNSDGGFGMSRILRPRDFKNALSFAWGETSSGRFERFHLTIRHLRPRHDSKLTHWSQEPLAWGESNLWDSWFRMFTIALILRWLGEKPDFESISFPGIGWVKNSH